MSFQKWILAILVFGIALGLSAQASKPKVALVIYIDLSPSMDRHRHTVSKMAGWITEELKTKCGDYQVLVNNLNYLSRYTPGGEIIKGYKEPDWVSKDTPDGKEMIRRRVEYNSLNPAFHYMTLFHSSSREQTYTSVLRTLEDRLQSLPGGFTAETTVGVMMLTDAAPVFETDSPRLASKRLKQLLGDSTFTVGALGARQTNCMDTVFSESDLFDIGPEPDFSQINWLNEFTEINNGYTWDICSDDIHIEARQLEESVREYIMLLMQEAQCLAIM